MSKIIRAIRNRTTLKNLTKKATTKTVCYRSFDFSRHYGKVLMRAQHNGTYLIQPLDGSQAEVIAHGDILGIV